MGLDLSHLFPRRGISPPGRGKGKPARPPTAPSLLCLLTLCVLWAGCTSVSQMKKRYDAGDETQFDKILEVASRPDYPYATRKNAVRALGEIGDPRAVPNLINILRELSQRTTLQQESMVALGRIGDPSAVTEIGRLLDRSLTSAGEELRMVAMQVLGQLGGTEAAEILLNALSYYDRAMLLSESRSLKGVFSGDEHGLRALQDSLRRPMGLTGGPGPGLFPGQQGPAGGLFGPETGLPQNRIEDTTPKERDLAHQSLVRVGDPALPVIEQHISQRETTVTLRNELVEIIEQIRQGQADAPGGSG